MNYLAHLHLAGVDPLAQVGALMGDFVKGPVSTRFSPPLRAAIVLHRRVDSFTDRHQAFKRSRERLPREYRRFGGVIIDIFYDHLLARSWDQHHHQPLEQYADDAYQTLITHLHMMPPNMQSRVWGLVRHDAFVSYRKLDSVRSILAGIGKRCRRPVELGGAAEILRAQPKSFEVDFEHFYPDLQAFVQTETSDHKEPGHPREYVAPAA
jgi:acyl carrier protein phosphodiesterase